MVLCLVNLIFFHETKHYYHLLALVFGGLFGLFEDFVDIFSDRFTMYKTRSSIKVFDS
jgi:hypothetical protein